MKILSGILIFLLLGLCAKKGVSQTNLQAKKELSEIGVKEENKNNTAPIPVNSITVVNEVNGVITYAIVNGKINRELFNNSEKRDEITMLPGFVELSLSTDDGVPMQVKMYSEYAEEYLNKYFGKLSAQKKMNN